MKDYEILFERESDGSVRNDGITLYRTKTVKAGRALYSESFPIWDTRKDRGKARRLARERKHTKAQKKLNERNAVKRFEQKLNSNFDEGDYFLTVTYREGEQPADDERAARDASNYLLRLKRAYKKAGMELKYAMVTETTRSEKRGTRYHHHIVVNKGPDRDTVEKMWKHGIVNSRRIQTEDDGISRLARYMMKQTATREKYAQRFKCSKNLKEPRVTTADHRISPRKTEKIADDIRIAGKEIFEKQYPGYRVVSIEVKTSEWVSGAYIYAKMVLRE